MPLTGDSTILLPIDVSATELPSRAIFEFLQPVNVVVLGYYPVPKQTAPAHLKRDHESEAAERLDTVVAEFADTAHDVEDVLVFTKDRRDTIDRVADEHDCDAVLAPGDVTSVERILVPLRGDVNLDRIVSLVGDLVRTSDAEVTLFHAAQEGDDSSQGEFILRGAIDRLAEDGVDEDRLDWTVAAGGDPESEILALAPEYDVLILGETEPTLRERIIGAVLEPILDSVEIPTIVVRDVE